MHEHNRRATDREDQSDIAIELSGVLLKLDKGAPLTSDDVTHLKQIVRSARDQFLDGSADPRIRKLEMWVLVLVESSESKSVSRDHGPDVNHTTVTDVLCYHLAVAKLHELHRQGLDIKSKRRYHAQQVPNAVSRDEE